LHRGKEEYDMKRQEEIEMEGWKFKRYNRVPNFEQLQREI
jgi:very-short-patch-repair endonuclease